MVEGWNYSLLSSVCEEITSGGAAPQGDKYFINGRYPFVRVVDMGNLQGKKLMSQTRDMINDDGAVKLRLFPKGTILFTKSGASLLLNQRAVLNEPMFVVSHIGCLIPNENVTSDWLYYWMKTVDFNVYAHATTLPSLKLTTIKGLTIPVPPIPEQERIVARIEELFSQLDAGVETLKKAKAQLTVYRQAVLKESFEGRLTNHIPVSLSLSWASEEETKTLPVIPEEWRYIALKHLGDLGRGKSKHRPRNDPKLFVDGKYPFIQTGDVKAATNQITTFTKQYGEFGLSQSKLWPKGTLCITIAANIAETAFLGIDACFPDSVVGFAPNDSVLAKYIRYFVESQKIRLWAFAPATAQKNINLDALENLIVPYCSIDEQHNVISEIESRMSVCDSIEQTVDAALQQAEAMRQSVLKKAFEGGF